MDPSNTPTPSPALTASESSDSDEVNSLSARVYFGPILSPEKKFVVQDIALRAVHKSGVLDSPVRRSPRLSTHPTSPLQSEDPFSPQACDSEAKDGKNGEDGLTCVLPGEDIPTENDLQDEPSSVLATRIMRAFDNPSPPPRGRTYTDSEYIPVKDAQFPLLDVSVPPSPFRSVNLFERLNQLAAPFDDTSLVSTPPPSTSVPDDTRRTMLDASDMSQHNLISFESCPSSILKNSSLALPVADPTISTPSGPQRNVHDFLSESPERASHSEVHIDGAGDSSSRASGNTIGIHPPASEETRVPGEPLGSHPQRESEDKVDTTPLPHTSESQEPTPPLLSTNTSSSSFRDRSIDSDRTITTKARHTGMRTVAGGDSSSHHKLRSLSPQSADVLTQLLPSSYSGTQKQEASLPSEKVQQSEYSTLSLLNSPTHHPNLTNSTVQRPLVAPTPVWSKNALHGASPTKLIHTLDEVTRTPARRVPIHDAFNNVTPSLKKSAQLAFLEDQAGRFPKVGGDVFSRPDDTPRSPARRVPAMECMSSPSRSTASTFPRARSASVEPRLATATPARSRSVELLSTKITDTAKGKGPKFPRVFMTPKASTKLPYPLIATERLESSSTYPIPEENENEELGGADTNPTTGVVAPSPHKSQLKQPSVGSRIPRIGAKPYTRPRGAISSKNATTSQTPSNHVSKPVSHVRSRTETSHSSSDEAVNQNANELTSPNKSALQTLKRKRGAAATVNQSGLHPVKLRQVLPGMLGGKYAASSLPPEPNLPPAANLSRPSAPIPFRKVVDGMLSVKYASAKPSIKDGETPQLETSANVEAIPRPTAPTVFPIERTTSSITDQLSPDEQSPSPHTTASKNPVAGVLESPLDDASTSLANENDLGPSQGDGRSSKRSSRTRKSTSDVAGMSSNTSRAVPHGRRCQTRTENDRFMGMSATALKALTSSNTAKNQQTVAPFAMEVIRKEGLRPESPTVKMRTILERQREEKVQERKERAERRARKSDEGREGSDTEGVNELFEQLLDVGGPDRAVEGVASNRRDPGDEEEYETPEKQRSVKRLRFGEDAEEQTRPTKQVKWHRGLSTAVNLDDIHPQPRPRSNHVIAKGCLAPSAKNLRLDTLGNITDIDGRPPLQLVQEPVVIKKYLYDNDVEPDPAPIPVRTTRSKSKRSKS